MINLTKLFVTKTSLARLVRIDSRSLGIRNKLPSAVLLNGKQELPIEISEEFLEHTIHGTDLTPELDEKE